MFKGFKNALRGGIGTVAEKSQDIASNVVNDQEFSTTAIKDKLKETTKRTYKEGKLLYKEGAHEIRDKVGDENVDKVQTTTKDVAHNIKHYGAFGEDVLGYSDPQKELRKAVKAKEKAAKKAKKAKKKKGEKPEDLFDPANLAKYKQELEEKRKLASLAAPVSPGVTDASKSPTSPEASSPTFDQPQQPAAAGDKWSDDGSDEFDFGMQETKEKDGPSQAAAAEPEPEPENDWARFQAMTSGVDAIVKQKKDNLDSLKVTSYYQRKKTQDEIEEDARLARPKNLVGARKKKWVDLDEEGFEERDGVLNEEISDGDMSEEDSEEVIPETIEREKEPSDFVVTPEDEEVAEENDKNDEEEEEEEDFFNTEFVNEQLAVLDMKLNEIPDSPVDEGPDVFDTNYASDIVKKAEKERIKQEKAENDKVKFGYISAAADVLTGKAAAVELEHTRNPEAAAQADKKSEPEGPTIVRKRRRRGDPLPEPEKKAEPVQVVAEPTKEEEQTTNTPSALGSPADENEEKLSVGDEDIAFSEQKPDNQPPEEEKEEEDDPFDAAFDELAQESLKKVNIDELTAELYNDDLFDTTAADEVLNLASLTNIVAEEEKEEIVLDTFDDDRDPFDTSAFEHITKDFEEDLEFESLAKRDPNETSGSVAFDAGPDPFETVEKQIEDNQREEENAGWAAFDQVKRKKPSRPPKPPPPRPPRPAARPNPPAVNIDYASGRNTPAVIIKAPSTESVRSWNCTQSETLIIKNNIEALNASQIENEDEIDPFDTTEYEGLVKELKGQTEDPFDTSKVENLEPSKTELKLIEQELIGEKKGDEDNKDPFDTEFAEKVVPKEKEPEDPFDTGEPDPKEEEEEQDFDPFDTSVADKVIPIRKPKVSSKSTISIEDEDFDPSRAFSTSPKSPAPPSRPVDLPKRLEDDPFATREGSAPSCPPPVAPRKVRPEHQVKLTGRQRPKTAAQIEAEQAALQKQLAIVDSDDDFDPRADTPPTPKPKTPESPDPFDTDGVDPFDTSAVQIEE